MTKARESVESVRRAFEGDQKLSIRNASGNVNIIKIKQNKKTADGILRSTLKKKPYHIQMLARLS
jgi:hypothetical protein